MSTTRMVAAAALAVVFGTAAVAQTQGSFWNENLYELTKKREAEAAAKKAEQEAAEKEAAEKEAEEQKVADGGNGAETGEPLFNPEPTGDEGNEHD
ncbi:MAG: hypothetical protein AAGE80_12635 [Pseudomonadota bacterium]